MRRSRVEAETAEQNSILRRSRLEEETSGIILEREDAVKRARI